MKWAIKTVKNQLTLTENSVTVNVLQLMATWASVASLFLFKKQTQPQCSQ